MDAHFDATHFRLFDLPLELFVEIILWAQHMWREDISVAHDPYTGVKRQVSTSHGLVVRAEACCHGIEHSIVPCCLSASNLAVTPSPAHLMSQLSRGPRSVLLENSRIWALDNTFYKVLAQRSGRVTPASAQPLPGTAIQYRANALVAVHVCSCLIRGITTLYPTLQLVKLALPWGAPNDASASVESMLLNVHTEQNSELRHFDLEIYQSPHATLRPLISGILCSALQTSRFANARFFFYSPSMTSLYIEIPPERQPRFGGSFFKALAACAASLEYLTVDAAGGTFSWHGNIVTFPKLRFLRVAAPDVEAYFLLRRLKLPDTVDLHLEAVVDWRRRFALTKTGVHEVNFDSTIRDQARVWRYAAMLASPCRAGNIFGEFWDMVMSERGLWPTMSTAGLDIRLDSLTQTGARACSRFPEYVSMLLAASVPDMVSLLAGAGWDWRQSLPPAGKTTARRSLSVRDATRNAADREQLFNPRLVKPVYDVIRHLVRSVVSPRLGTYYNGRAGIRHLVLHQDSFLPTYTLGWDHVLGEFADLHSIVILCPRLRDGKQFTENSEGCLVPSHWQALAMYLNDGVTHTPCPCPLLESIQFPRYIPVQESSQVFIMRMENLFNKGKRVGLTSRKIMFALSVTDT